MTSTLVDAPAVPRPAIPPPDSPQCTPTRPRVRPVRYEPAPDADGTAPLRSPSLVRLPVGVPRADLPADARPVAARQTAARQNAAQQTAAEQAEAEQAEAQAQRAASRVLRLALEVLDGRRPAGHLDGHLAPPVSRYWRAAARQRQMRTPARFRRIRLCLPHSDAAEVAATCDIDGRPRALAARFDRRDSRWVCTALRLV